MQFSRDEREFASEVIAAAKQCEAIAGEEGEVARLHVVRRLISIPMGVEDAGRSQALVSIARSLWRTGRRVIDAVEPAALGVSLSRQAGDRVGLCRGLLVQGAILKDLLNLTDAWGCFEEAAEVARGLDSPHAHRLESQAVSNLGVVLLDLGRYRVAVELFQLALELAEREAEVSPEGAAQRRGIALANIALTCWHMRSYERGVAACEEAIQLLGDPADAGAAHAAALAESIYARLLATAGQPTRAMERARHALAWAEVAGSAHAALEACGAASLAQAFLGQAEEARCGVLVAIDGARRLPVALRNALYTAAVAMEAVGDASAALEHHREFEMLSLVTMRSVMVTQQVGPLATADESLERLLGEQERRFRESLARQLGTRPRLMTLALRAEAFADPEGFHIYRVGRLAGLLALEIGGDVGRRSAGYELAAQLHDVGMIGVPRMTQQKTPQQLLTDKEKEFFRRHPEEGAEMVARCDLADGDLVHAAVRSHHERFDGAGYPAGLRGEAIPLAGRITALADAYDVMTHDRPYVPARSSTAALEEIRSCLGGQFDPELGAVFIGMIRRLQADHGDLEAFLTRAAKDMPIARAGVVIERARAMYLVDA